jgi:glucose/arabinose dehydrogenase
MMFCNFRLLLSITIVSVAPWATAAADALPKIQLTPVATGLVRPLCLADDGRGRLFVVEQMGRILQLDGGQLREPPFLDLSAKVSKRNDERGMKCLVFHPKFNENGRFFVNYATGTDEQGEIRISEFKVASAQDTTALVDSERVILRIPWPHHNHGGGQLAFGPDGMLYIGNGDNGDQNDPDNVGQQLNTLRGKILRINVDGELPYGIPKDNPFVEVPMALPEIWAYGLRNPWRFSFDRKTQQLFCGDVGQNKREEINLIEKGRNYGWSAREGTLDFRPERKSGELTDPIKDYPRQDAQGGFLGVSITGGYVYRGKAISGLQGVYLYADYVSGRVWGLKYEGNRVTTDVQLLQAPIAVASFGEDHAGELYIVDYHGNVLKIEAAAP